MSDATSATPTSASDAGEPFSDLRPNGNEVLIRMYGQGLGDCFLLAFPRAQPTNAAPTVDPQRPVYVLIDCGVLSATPDPAKRMQQIVADIRRTTRDDPSSSRGHLDLLILTHEHWDHLSGFIYADAKAEWKNIQIDALWTAWTAADDPEGLAGILGKLREQAQNALQAIAARPVAADDARAVSVRDLTAFLLDLDPQSRTFALSTQDGLAFAKNLVDGDHTLCEPGEVRPVPGTDAVAYVLGPPRDWARLSKMNPDSDAPETYVHGSGGNGFAIRRLLSEPSSFNAFVTPLLAPPLAAGAAPDAAGAPPRAERDVYSRSFPFDRTFRVPIPAAEREAAAREGVYPALDAYFDEINDWRRIDSDWLMAAEGFALWVDNFINNTSLALAFELPAARRSERKVLLFVADAQVGNWLSWDELGEEWRRRDGARPGQRKPDMGDLLARTVFYKVGHHGSHNATLKALGVERMRDDGKLTAFVPVSKPVAMTVGWDEMPLPELLDALAERSGGRVVFPDGNVWPPAPTAQARRRAQTRIGVAVSSTKLPAKRRKGDRADTVIEDEVPLWVQIAIDY